MDPNPVSVKQREEDGLITLYVRVRELGLNISYYVLWDGVRPFVEEKLLSELQHAGATEEELDEVERQLDNLPN